VLPNTDLPTAAATAERIRAAIAAYDWAALQPELQVTLSLGVADGWAGGADQMLAEADTMLYAAKRGGKNQVRARES
jgi:diguanylate cyclase (GGDEF)-like protein